MGKGFNGVIALFGIGLVVGIIGAGFIESIDKDRQNVVAPTQTS